MYILSAQNITFGYGDRTLFEHCSVNFKSGVFYALLGESGSGKTTFLSLLGGLEKVKKGVILYDGKNIAKMNEGSYLREAVSFIFQDYNLISYMNAIDNVLLAMSIHGVKANKEKAIDSLKEVGLKKETFKQKVKTLSGGERQRVAIARAIACDSKIILADEPTGNLDEETAANITKLFKDLAHKCNKCVIVATHSDKVSQNADIAIILDQSLKRFVPLYEHH